MRLKTKKNAPIIDINRVFYKIGFQKRYIKHEKVVTLNGGDVFAVPLFLADLPFAKSFARESFRERGDEFGFLRIIKDMQGGGFLAKVFDLVGSLETTLEEVFSAERLFRPITVPGLGVKKKRWRLIGTQKAFDEERDARFSEIQLVIGDREAPRLWQNGKEKPISKEESAKLERWTVWMPNQL